MRDEDVVRVHEAGLRILDQTGVLFEDVGALTFLRECGCRVDGTRVRIPGEVVATALNSVPRSFALRGRTGRELMFGDGLVAAAASGAPFIVERHNMRRAMIADLQKAVQLVQALPNLDIVSPPVEPADVQAERRHRTVLFHCLTLTNKPLIWPAAEEEQLRESLDIAAIMWGPDWHQEARLFSVLNSSSPLCFDKATCAAITSFARLGQPICVTSCAMAGITGPITLAGILALQHAEVLAGLTLVQAVREGAPFVYGGTSSVSSMATGNLLLGVPQYWKLMNATVDLARLLRLPCRAGGGLTDAHLADVQAGIETAMSLATVAQAGAHFVMHAAGVLSAFNALSFEKLVIDDELVGSIREWVNADVVNDETLALDAIGAVGPGGSYLLQPHTLRHCRDYEHHTFFNRQRHDAWIGRGAMDVVAAAGEYVGAVLDSYQEPAMDVGIRRRLEEYCLA